MGTFPGIGVEHPGIAGARRGGETRRLLVAVATGAVGERGAVGQHAAAAARGPRLRPRCATPQRAATRHGILSPRAPGVLAQRVRVGRPGANGRGARGRPRPRFAHQQAAGRPGAARREAVRGSGRAGAGRNAGGSGTRDGRPPVHGARRPGPLRRLARGGAGRVGTPPRGRDAPADGSEGSSGRAVTAAPRLRLRTVAELARRGGGPDPETLATAARIVRDERKRGEGALRQHAQRCGEAARGAPLYYDRPELARALAGLAPEDRARLERVAARIRAFAVAQRSVLGPVSVPVPGGVAEHRIAPMERAGCYAPGGRYPLPSSVLMTAVTARVAGVRDVWVASPKPHPLTLAAAAVAGANGVLGVGGAQAIAALAYGAGPIAPRDVIVGPGNRWGAAAKQLVTVEIDMLAGPSELVVFADESADPAAVAADLLAQAEHDPDALPVLVTVDATLVKRVERELASRLDALPTAAVARAALAQGGAIVVSSVAEGVAACDAIAPEHLHLALRDADAVAPRLAHYGALFVGAGSAEVLGDYGAGPNHVLPTGGTARSSGGLSVYTFLRVRTWLRITDGVAARPLIEDAIWLALAEGLEGHARAAKRRLGES